MRVGEEVVAVPETALALSHRFGIGDLIPLAFALKALTALGNGEGQILLLQGDEWLVLLTAHRGEWKEKETGRVFPLPEEPFALQALRKRRFTIAPFGVMRGQEPFFHGAAFLRLGPLEAVLTLDLPLKEFRFFPLWGFPVGLLRRIAQGAWGETVPDDLLPWTLWGREGVVVWDAKGRVRWCRGEVPPIPRGKEPFALTPESAWLRTAAGTVLRRLPTLSPSLWGLSLVRSEIHHRVKNDLQSVAGLLRVQARRLSHEGAKKALLEAAERVKAFATVHDLLARVRGETLELRALIQRLGEALLPQAEGEQKRLRFLVIGPPIPLSPSQASALAPALHELLRNACEHAFDPGDEGTITVHIRRESDKVYVTVADDGKGFDLTALNGSSLGLTIVRNLIGQDLRGGTEIQTAVGKGTQVRIWFPLKGASGKGH